MTCSRVLIKPFFPCLSRSAMLVVCPCSVLRSMPMGSENPPDTLHHSAQISSFFQKRPSVSKKIKSSSRVTNPHCPSRLITMTPSAVPRPCKYLTRCSPSSFIRAHSPTIYPRHARCFKRARPVLHPHRHLCRTLTP